MDNNELLKDENISLKKEYEKLMDKSNEQFKDICILSNKLNNCIEAFEMLNKLIQATTDDDIMKLKQKLKVLKDVSILTYRLINKQ